MSESFHDLPADPAPPVAPRPLARIPSWVATTARLGITVALMAVVLSGIDRVGLSP